MFKILDKLRISSFIILLFLNSHAIASENNNMVSLEDNTFNSSNSAVSYKDLRGIFSTISQQEYLNFLRLSVIEQPEYLFSISQMSEKDMFLRYANRQRFPELSFQIINDESIDRDIDDAFSIRKRRDDSFDASVEISQTIYSGGSINAQVGIARKEFSMSKLMKEEALSSQILRANEVYLKAISSNVLYKYGQSILDEAIPFLEKVRERVQLGISDPIQLAVFSIKFNNLESKVQILRTDRNRDVGVYEFFFKTKFDNESFPEVLIPPLSMDYNRKAYEVENSILDYEAKKEETKLTRSEFLPQFGIRTRYTEYDIDDDEGEDSDIRGGIYFSMPVFTFGRASAKISSSKAKEKAYKQYIDVERKTDDTLETEIVNVIDSSMTTRKEIFKAYEDTRKQSSIIKERLEITNFSPDAYIDSALEELRQLERFISTETSLLHGYMLYKHQNRELTSLIRITP